MDILCTSCNSKIGEYGGPIGWTTPIEAQFFTRIDGTQPADGEEATHECPACHTQINEVIATATAINTALIEDSANAAPDSDTGQRAPDDAIRDVREAPQDP